MIDPDELMVRIDALPTREKEYERNYLGASEIGSECARALWLQFHKYAEPEEFEPRMLRLFQRGKDEEYRFEGYIYQLGIEILHNSDDQVGFHDGFFAGHGDGVYLIDGDRVAAEWKTHSENSFKQLRRGNLKQSHPKHYAQCIVYAGKFNCKYALYGAVNKNNDALFFDVIPFDDKEFGEYLLKADYITMADKPPDRIATKPTAYACKFCHVKDVCFGFVLPRVHCFNCTSASKNRKNAKITCEIKDQEMPDNGHCENHSFNPHAMQSIYNWSPVEFWPKYRSVEYTLPSGEKLINGKAPFGVESKDLKL